MQEAHLVLFAQLRPFEPFRVFTADGRVTDVTHAEMVMVGDYALALWLFHDQGGVEVIDGTMITALRTLGSVDPDTFAGSVKG